VLTDLIGPLPTAGFFAAGEMGPVGGRNFLHGFTASLALFSDPQDPPAHMGENGASQLP
jgi:small ligand-binding sensory domain FIST